MSDALWEPTPEAVQQASQEITKRFSAFIRALRYAREHLQAEYDNSPEDAGMIELEDLDVYDLQVAVIHALRGAPIPDRYDLMEPESAGLVPEEEWLDAVGWMLGQFPNDPDDL